MRVVIDTNVLVSALLSRGGKSRQVLRLCLNQTITPLINVSLFSEYEDLMSRDKLFTRSLINRNETMDLFNALMSCSEWINVYYKWRPNLTDEADNYLIELAVAGNANYLITHNLKDFQSSELVFPDICVIAPNKFCKEVLSCQH